MDDTEKIPPFIQQFLDKMDFDGYTDFVNLSRKYYKEQENYPGKFAEQSAHLNDFNRRTGQNRQLNYDEGLNRIEADYKKSAYELAKQHGFQGSDPNQPTDKEFSKQGVKFQGMINKFQQSQRQKEKLAEPENKIAGIRELKEEQPYQQNQPTVEFKEVEQENTDTQQFGRDKERAAFLEQIKKTREQAQRNADREPEL